MVYSEIIAVCSQSHTKHINTLCGRNVELLNVTPSGAYSYHWYLFPNCCDLNSTGVISISQNVFSLAHNSICCVIDPLKPNIILNYIYIYIYIVKTHFIPHSKHTSSRDLCCFAIVHSVDWDMLPTFWNNLSVPSARVRQSKKTLQDGKSGTDRLPRNVRNKRSIYSVYILRRPPLRPTPRH
jgi:hypothetical protein